MDNQNSVKGRCLSPIIKAGKLSSDCSKTTQRHAPLWKCGRINGLKNGRSSWKACTASPVWVKGTQGQKPADISNLFSPSIHSSPMGFLHIRQGCSNMMTCWISSICISVSCYIAGWAL